MKRIIGIGLATLLAVPVLSTVAIYAEGSGSSSGSNSSESSSDNKTTAEATTPTNSTDSNQATSDDIKGLADRLAARKAELKTKLTTLEKTKITTKCVAAQGLISSVKGRVKGIETSRGEVYKNMVDRLTDLSGKLKAKNVDTTALDADIATLQGKITTFNTDLATYKQAVTDLSAMDCKSDPDGFKASLDAARSALTKVSQDALAIRSYVNDTIKPLLKTIRDQLAKTESSENNATGNSTSQGTTGGNQ
ncbi:MAG TPA: hypothetical protein VLF87_03130 [Patescibacteria group bacterium]|nr:hypothetical protein [Patescibacteria group bacterium]